MIKNCKLERRSVTQLFVVLFILVSYHQGVSQKYSLGVKGGASLTWPSFGDREARDVFNRRLKPGFNAGFIIGFPLKDNYNLILEGGASQRGRILTFNKNPKWENNLTMQMADMSMMLRRSFKFMLRKDTPAEGFFNLGPEINYWIRSNGFLRVTDGPKYKYDVIFGEDTNPDVAGDYTLTLQDANRWLFSLGLGVGLKAPLKKNKYLTTELRFSSGHTFLGKPNSAFMERFIWGEGNMQDTMRTNLKSISLSVGYTIDFDKVEKKKGKSTIKKKLKR